MGAAPARTGPRGLGARRLRFEARDPFLGEAVRLALQRRRRELEARRGIDSEHSEHFPDRLLRCGGEVLVHDPFVADEKVQEVGARKVELDELLENAKVVSLHARLTDETLGMIGVDQLAKMPEGSVLVNTARGGLLDYEALCDALESGHLGAAALDVYDEEPPREGSRLFTAPNLVLSPHIAGATRETAHRAANIAAAEVGRYARGEKLANVVNSEVLDGT